MDSETLRTQKEQILDHMNKYGGITYKTAVDQYGILRLASRIAELKKEGFEIHTIWESGKNRFGKKTKWVKYRLGRKEDYDT